ncbi:hypothetical protein QR680_016643 [Steinernema hermaphroditum]|uniref:Uncharacterized protein n=1 Tax=Steinernema hermaphroditum TaxID=289476 RepID=A0AA39HBV7_9BILA|nr:hypothetical protein QR680_016643 [Steinernema hermaphroditum]
MTNFGDVEWSFNSRYGCKKLIVTPISNNEQDSALVYTWAKYRGGYRSRTTGEIRTTFACTGCRQVLTNTRAHLPTIIVDMASNVFLSDPIDPLLEHVCEPREREEVLGMQVRREAIAKLKKNGGRIGATFTELPQRVLEKHSEESSVIKDNIRGHACGSSEVTKRTFRRARAQRFPTVKSLDEIPDQYSVTMAGLNSQHNDPVYQEKLLIFKSPEIAIFMSPYGTPDTLWQLGEGGSDPTAILLELRDCFTPDLHSEDFFPFARFTDVLE